MSISPFVAAVLATSTSTTTTGVKPTTGAATTAIASAKTTAKTLIGSTPGTPATTLGAANNTALHAANTGEATAPVGASTGLGLKTTDIVGLAVGGAVLTIIIVAVVVYLVFRRQHIKASAAASKGKDPETGGPAPVKGKIKNKPLSDGDAPVVLHSATTVALEMKKIVDTYPIEDRPHSSKQVANYLLTPGQALINTVKASFKYGKENLGGSPPEPELPLPVSSRGRGRRAVVSVASSDDSDDNVPLARLFFKAPSAPAGAGDAGSHLQVPSGCANPSLVSGSTASDSPAQPSTPRTGSFAEPLFRVATGAPLDAEIPDGNAHAAPRSGKTLGDSAFL